MQKATTSVLRLGASIKPNVSRLINGIPMAVARKQEMNVPVEIDSKNIEEFVNYYDNFLFDCDGVLWAKDHITPIPGISSAIEKLRKRGKKLFFVTNNSMHGRDAYVEKFKALPGFTANKEDVFGVAYAAAVYLKEIVQVKGSVYMIGSKGMKAELDEFGIEHFGSGPDPDPIPSGINDLYRQDLREDVGAVLVGYDENFSYNKLFKASCYLSRQDCHYVATNDVERRVQIGPNVVQPITGSLVSAVSAASNRSPVVVGKPHRYMLQCIAARNPGIDFSRTVMVGDSLKADIHFAKNSGLDSVLVLTGVSTRSNLTDYKELGIEPTYILPTLADIGHYLS